MLNEEALTGPSPRHRSIIRPLNQLERHVRGEVDVIKTKSEE